MSEAMVSVRAKFVVTSVKSSYITEGDKRQILSSIELAPVIGPSEENKAFFKWTPSGSIKMDTVNSKAAEVFVPGQEYYVDFTFAE